MNLQEIYSLEELPLDLNIPDIFYLLLFSGVGVYSPSNKSLSSNYYDLILNLASNGQLAFMLADDSICYGANYPFSNVIISDDIADVHSISTIFQLAGRAGRVGTSYQAFIRVGNNTGNRIMNYIHGKESTGISKEGYNINHQFQIELNNHISNPKPIIKPNIDKSTKNTNNRNNKDNSRRYRGRRSHFKRRYKRRR
jgi:hypothetical protein